MLAGCGEPLPATVNKGECRAFKRAAIEVCGLTQSDQDVIDDGTERGVAACRWRRPEPRVPSCADLRAEIASLRASAMKQKLALPPATEKKSLWRRALGR
jgi:hypothetical protein